MRTDKHTDKWTGKQIDRQAGRRTRRHAGNMCTQTGRQADGWPSMCTGISHLNRQAGGDVHALAQQFCAHALSATCSDGSTGLFAVLIWFKIGG